MKKVVIATLASSLVLAGCATTENKAVLGAIGGALSGAAISKATGGTETGRDAAIGAALGAGVGYYMQQQEAKLRQQTAGTGIEVSRDPITNNINLAIPEAVTFDVGQSTIKSGFYRTLNQVADTLREYNQSSVVINGYASIEGNSGFNQMLSENRAETVKYYLVNRGIAENRLRAIGHGGTTKFGSAYEPNRRVEMTILAPQNVR